MKYKFNFLVFGLMITTLFFGQVAKPTEYLGVAGPISFNKISYNIAWSSNPTDSYYKQEYLAKGETVEKFSKMILLEVLTGNSKPKEVVATKVAELKRMKATNPIVQYETFEKDGEIMLDFMVSENTPDGKNVSIVERNVYRYKSIVDKNGEKAFCFLELAKELMEMTSTNSSQI